LAPVVQTGGAGPQTAVVGKLIGIILVWHVHDLLWPMFHHKWQIAGLFYLKALKALF
jgi:hypothetical protein